MKIEDGDVLFLERVVSTIDGQDVDQGAYGFGHAEIGYRDHNRVNRLGEEMVTKWLQKHGSTKRHLEAARTRVYRSKASESDRRDVALAVDCISHGTEYGNWRAVTSVFRSSKHGTHRALRGKYYERALQYAMNEEKHRPPHVMKKAFCSEIVVAAVQMGAMFSVARLLHNGMLGPSANDDMKKLLSLAKQHRLWLDTRAKATLPSGLESILKSSANWDYLGLYKKSDDDDAADFIRLKNAILRGISNYNDRTTLGVFKWTSTATSDWIPVLRSVANRPLATVQSKSHGAAVAMLRYAIVWAMPGVTLAPGKESTPWAEGNLMPNLRALNRDSRLYRCLLLTIAQNARDQFQFDAAATKEVQQLQRAR
jgi:hypothetical protein